MVFLVATAAEWSEQLKLFSFIAAQAPLCAQEDQLIKLINSKREMRRTQNSNLEQLNEVLQDLEKEWAHVQKCFDEPFDTHDFKVAIQGYKGHTRVFFGYTDSDGIEHWFAFGLVEFAGTPYIKFQIFDAPTGKEVVFAKSTIRADVSELHELSQAILRNFGPYSYKDNHCQFYATDLLIALGLQDFAHTVPFSSHIFRPRVYWRRYGVDTPHTHYLRTLRQKLRLQTAMDANAESLSRDLWGDISINKNAHWRHF